MPRRFTWSALAPAGTVTKMLLVRFRSTLVSEVVEYGALPRSVGATTAAIITWSTTVVAGSSIRRIAECTPADGFAAIRTETALFSGSDTVLALVKVPSLPTHFRLCLTAFFEPDVRVIFTV